MAMNTSQLWGAVEPVVRKYFGLEKNKYEPEYSKIFDVSKGKEPVRHSMEFGGPGQLAMKAENAPVANFDIKQGNNKTWVYTVYAGEMTMSFELARDVRYQAIKTIAQAMGRAVSLTPEYLAALFLDRSFNAAYPATADGQPVCSTTHTIIQTNSATGSNAAATPAALSETSLEDVMTSLLTMVGPDGMITRVNPEMLIVPAALSWTAEKLSMSDKQVGSANNNPSVVATKRSGIKPMTFRYLGSATRWFVKTDYPNGLWWEWDIEADHLEDTVVNNLQKTMVTFFRERHGIDDWRGLFGVNAT